VSAARCIGTPQLNRQQQQQQQQQQPPTTSSLTFTALLNARRTHPPPPLPTPHPAPGIYPQSVKSPVAILSHHLCTALYMMIPYYYPQYHW